MTNRRRRQSKQAAAIKAIEIAGGMVEEKGLSKAYHDLAVKHYHARRYAKALRAARTSIDQARRVAPLAVTFN